MAKGNMLQGMARGKVGDVVFSRLNGQQISRVRNRQPYNPRTNKQLYQRAIMATVMLAYSAGKSIFNHSFQGKAVGSECQREFMRLNAKHLRELIANDINNNVTLLQQQGRVVAPKAVTPVAFPCIISQGSYPQNFFVNNTTGRGFDIPAKEENETCAHYCERCGLVPGDLYTIVAIGMDFVDGAATAEEAMSVQTNGRFGYTRLQVKENALTDTTPIGNYLAKDTSTNGVPFVITESVGTTSETEIDFESENCIRLSDAIAADTGAFGVIRSRIDADLRSNSTMKLLIKSDIPEENSGIASQFILDVWKAGAVSVGDSDLILEGGDI